MTRLRLLKGLGKGGFTLIELMVAIAIIGILAAISVPNYAAFRNKAQWAAIEKTLRYLADGQDMYFMENDTFFPRRGRINVRKGAFRQISELAYTFPDGHPHRYRIRGITNRRNNRYIIDVWCDYNLNNDRRGRSDRIQLQTWYRDGRIFRGFDRSIRHWR